jgi:FlaA1/EpsC-like NDP-sugar epimerase
MTRYFMTIPEAAQLILQAGALGEGGEIFVLQMGTPVRVADMATDLIRLYGKEPGRDIDVIFTGLRPGEKLYEELITEGEDVTRTSHEKIMTLKYNGRWNWNGLSSQDNFRNWLDKGIAELYRTAESHDACAIRQKLKELVPEYMPQESDGVLKGVQLSKRISYIPAGLSNVNTCSAGARMTGDKAAALFQNSIGVNREQRNRSIANRNLP